MPIAVVMTPGGGAIPALLHEETAALLLARLAELKGTPALGSVDDARTYLAGLPQPSGWYETVDEARAAVARLRTQKRQSEMTGIDLKAIRTALDMPRDAFGEALGYAGNANTRHKQVYEMEQGTKPIMEDAAQKARALAVEAGLRD